MVTYGADMVVLGIYMGIVFMTCTVVILTTIYVLKQGLGKTDLGIWKQLWTWKQHKFRKEPQVATAVEPVPVNEPIEEQAHPPDLEKDGNTPIVTQTSPEVSPVSVSPPIEGKQAAIPSPDTSSPEPEPAASHQEPTQVSETEPKQSEPVSAQLVQSEDVRGNEPDMNKSASLNQATELKANDAIPEQTPEPAASHQEPTQVSEAEPKQSEPVSAQLVQSEGVRGTEPDRNKRTASSNQVVKVKYIKPRQEEATKLKANDAIPEQTSEPATSHQEPNQVSETEPKQSEPANAELVQSEPVQPETQPQETPAEKTEVKETMGDLNDLFSEEILEESDSNKIASSLSDVDVFHLAADARSLLDNLKKDNSDTST